MAVSERTGSVIAIYDDLYGLGDLQHACIMTTNRCPRRTGATLATRTRLTIETKHVHTRRHGASSRANAVHTRPPD
eukprot:4904215-Prymnesium_polylepis.1